MNADAGGLRRRAERIRELVVRKVVDVAQPERVELALRQLGERVVEAVEPGSSGSTACGLAVEALENAEPGTGRALETATADGRGQDVARDREEPGSRGSTRNVVEASASEPRLRERLCGQVVGGVRVPAPREMEAVHPLGVPVVELAERLRVGARRAQELCFGRHALAVSVVMATSTSVSS